MKDLETYFRYLIKKGFNTEYYLKQHGFLKRYTNQEINAILNKLRKQNLIINNEVFAYSLIEIESMKGHYGQRIIKRLSKYIGYDEARKYVYKYMKQFEQTAINVAIKQLKNKDLTIKQLYNKILNLGFSSQDTINKIIQGINNEGINNE